MNIFLDTSSLFKLYHLEDDSQEMMELIENNPIEEIFLAQLTKIEFESVIWKKVRKKELDEIKAQTLIQIFRDDYKNYTFIAFNDVIENEVFALMNKYGTKGLRTLDAIQFSTAIYLKKMVNLNKTADNILHKLFLLEGLQT